MKTLTLIDRLTWAIVEISNPVGQPDLAKIGAVLNEALELAILTHGAEERLKATLIKTAQVMGE